MATTAFHCDEENFEGSVRSLQLKQRGCSYRLLQVLVGVLAVLVLVATGGIIWMKLSQNCLNRSWPVKFTGTDRLIDTDFTSPESAEYEISGKIFIKEPRNDRCNTLFRLLEKLPNNTKPIMTQNITEEVVNKTVKLDKGSGLRIELNCNGMKFDEAKSILNVFQKTCY
ncbi:hypothetical protein PO909_010626 [Leuciscus waleckii]